MKMIKSVFRQYICVLHRWKSNVHNYQGLLDN